MKKSIAILVYTLFFLSAKSQDKKNIIYILPDSVEVTIDNYIHKFASLDTAVKYFGILSYKKDSDCIEILIQSYSTKSKDLIADWTTSSNRVIIVDKNELPVLFDYDFCFGLSDRKNIGKIGQREGVASRIFHIPHHYLSIIFSIKNYQILKVFEE